MKRFNSKMNTLMKKVEKLEESEAQRAALAARLRVVEDELAAHKARDLKELSALSAAIQDVRGTVKDVATFVKESFEKAGLLRTPRHWWKRSSSFRTKLRRQRRTSLQWTLS